MRSVMILGLLAASTLLEAGERIRIGIRLQTPTSMPPALVTALMRETERRWDFPNLELRWLRAGERSSFPVNRLLIVQLVGECSLDQAGESPSSQPPLRANIIETLPGPLITEQGENGSQSGNEEEDCSRPCGFACRGAE